MVSKDHIRQLNLIFASQGSFYLLNEGCSGQCRVLVIFVDEPISDTNKMA